MSFGQLDTIKKIVKYNLIFEPDSNNRNHKLSEKFDLIIGNDFSMYVSQYLLKREAYIADLLKQGSLGTLSEINLSGLPKSRFQSKIIFRNGDSVLQNYSQILMEKYWYEFNIPTWKITLENKTIGTYKCQQATGNYGGRNFIIWFAPDIPIFDGPFVFKNLPGLVIQAYDVKMHYLFEFESIDQPPGEATFEVHDESAQKLSRKEFKNVKRNFQENTVLQLEQNGFKMSDENKETFMRNRENAKRVNNNPLELE